jgi:hypothetical protein
MDAHANAVAIQTLKLENEAGGKASRPARRLGRPAELGRDVDGGSRRVLMRVRSSLMLN